MKDVLERLTTGIASSFAALGGDGARTLAAYALCIDADFRTLYAAAFTADEARTFEEPYFAFLPAEWPHEDCSGELRAASDALEAWADAQYASEGDDVGPGDDHLRPWKREAFEAVVGALVDSRRAGVLPEHLPVWLTCHDPSDDMAAWIREGVARLNEPTVVDRWRDAWASWYG